MQTAIQAEALLIALTKHVSQVCRTQVGPDSSVGGLMRAGQACKTQMRPDSSVGGLMRAGYVFVCRTGEALQEWR